MNRWLSSALVLIFVSFSIQAETRKPPRSAKSPSTGSAARQKSVEDCELWLVTQTPGPGEGTLAMPSAEGCIAYVGPLRGGKPEGRGSYRLFPQTSLDARPTSYEGEFKDGKFHGQGNLYRRAGQGYVGEFVNGEKHGRGKADDQYYTYEGEISHGKWTGKGLRITWADREAQVERERYEGEMLDGMAHGKGIYVEKSGDKLLYRYEGEWRNGKHHGRGIEVDGRWSKYAEGNFVAGEMQGEGHRIAWGTGAPQRLQLLSGEWKGTKLLAPRALSWPPSEPQFSTYVPRFDGKKP